MKLFCEIDELEFSFGRDDRKPRLLRCCGKTICTACCVQLLADARPCPFCRAVMEPLERIPINRILDIAGSELPEGYEDEKVSKSGDTLLPPKSLKGSVVSVLEPKGVIALRSTHGTFLRSDGTGCVSLVGHCLAYEHWKVVQVYPGIFALKCWNGRFLRAKPSGEVDIQWWMRDWERWRLLEIDGHTYLESIHSTYLRADPKGTLSVVKERLEWERWTVFDVVGLQAFHGKFLGATPDGKVHLVDEKKEWEVWRIGRVSDDFVIIVSFNGKYLSGCSSGEITAVSERSDNTLWKLEQIDGKTNIQHSTKLYLRANTADLKLVDFNLDFCKWKIVY